MKHHTTLIYDRVQEYFEKACQAHLYLLEEMKKILGVLVQFCRPSYLPLLYVKNTVQEGFSLRRYVMIYVVD